MGDIERGQVISDFLRGWKTLTLFEKTALLGYLSSFTSLFFLRKSKFLILSISGPLPLLVLSQSFFYVPFSWFELKGWNGGVLINLNLSECIPSFLTKAYKSTDSRLLRAIGFEGSVHILFCSSCVKLLLGDSGNIIWLAKVSFDGTPALEKGALSALLCFWHGKSSFCAVLTCRAMLSSLFSP